MILVVDDSPMNIDVLIEAIGDLDDVAVALDGEEALSIVNDERPLAVLLDIVMPGIDGFEVCRRMKADPALAEIPVIFLSGNDSEEDREQGRAAGGTDYLVKPLSPEAVVAAVKPYIS